MSELEQVRDIVSERFLGGTRVINCVVHTGRLSKRPRDCSLCRTDLENQFEYALRVNDWMNGVLDRVRKILGIPLD